MKLFYLLLSLLLLISCNGNEKASDASANTPSNQAALAIKDSLADASSTDLNQSENPSASPGILYGIDVSKFQGDEVDFLSIKKDSLSFVICKATGGNTYTDPDFKKNRTHLIKEGFIHGNYHFYYCQDDPLTQANHFVATVNGFSDAQLPPIVDFEEYSLHALKTIDKNKIKQDLLSFLTHLTAKTNRLPMLYSDNNTANKYLSHPDFAKYPLWIADYRKGNFEQPVVPRTWSEKDWLFWQKSSSYVMEHTKNDFDVFNGNAEDLQHFIASTILSDSGH